jgi:hypothetical protein
MLGKRDNVQGAELKHTLMPFCRTPLNGDGDGDGKMDDDRGHWSAPCGTGMTKLSPAVAFMDDVRRLLMG